eukprot:GFUD01010987.1.p1 GENE.GFUD01010987.1~~GFUD01010987.1.p1  ORF type:complete len:376 (-),score=81.19 GFUD01010987.1:3-1130(-)
MSSLSPSMCTSSSNVFSWKISLDEWTNVAKGEFLPLQFETVIPPQGQKAIWRLEVFPKGSLETKETIDIRLGFFNSENDFVFDDDDMDYFHIETAYKIFTGRSLDMSHSRSLYSFHSSIFKQFSHHWLGDSYKIGSVSHLHDENKFLTLEFEIKMTFATRMKFQWSCDKQMFVNNFGEFHRDSGDVKILCCGKEILFDKLLLTSQSPVFKAMFEQDSKENKESCVDITDCTPEAVEEFKFFLYHAKMRPVRFTSVDLELIIGVVHLSSKYQVWLLMDICKDVLMDILNVDNVLKIMVVIDKYELGHTISEMVSNFMKENIAMIVDKEDWSEFLGEYPALVKDLVLDMKKEMVDTNDALKNARNNVCATCFEYCDH